MKTKLVLLTAVMAGSALSVSAQEGKKYVSESWKDNFFISVGAGIQGTPNPDTKFGKSITPLINVSVGKLITPVWGVRAQGYGWSSKLVTDYPFADYNGAEVTRKETYAGINVDGMVNLTNLFCGYKPGRAFEVNFFAGPSMNIVKNFSGWELGYKNEYTPVEGGTQVTQVVDPATSKPAGHAWRCLVGASLGLGAKYNITPEWAIDLEARGQVTPSIMGSLTSAKTDGYFHFTVGATYTIGGKKFIENGMTEAEKKAVNDKLNDYRNQLQQKDQALAAAQAQNQTSVKEVIKETVVPGPRAIFFKIGTSKLDDYGKVNIKLAAQIMKNNPDKKYKIAGYADKATGSKRINEKLAKNRAQVVYDALIQEGVNASQLEMISTGTADNMFGKDALNRVVILE